MDGHDSSVVMKMKELGFEVELNITEGGTHGSWFSKELQNEALLIVEALEKDGYYIQSFNQSIYARIEDREGFCVVVWSYYPTLREWLERVYFLMSF